jgi:hypothetical protein
VVDDDATQHSQPPIANDLPLRSSSSDLNKVPDVSAADVVAAEPSVPGLNDNSAPHINNEVPESEIKISTQEVSEAGPGTSKDIVSTDQALEAALQEAVRAEADSHADGEDDMPQTLTNSLPLHLQAPLKKTPEALLTLPLSTVPSLMLLIANQTTTSHQMQPLLMKFHPLSSHHPLALLHLKILPNLKMTICPILI